MWERGETFEERHGTINHCKFILTRRSIITLAYFFMFLVYTLIAYSRLLQVPWTQYRYINISFRILIIQTLPVLLTFAVSSAIHAFRNVRLFEHCASTGWRTTPEICIALAVWIFIRCYCTSPLMRGEYVESIRSTTVRNYLWVEPGDRVIETRPFWEVRTCSGPSSLTAVLTKKTTYFLRDCDCNASKPQFLPHASSNTLFASVPHRRLYP